MIIQVEINETEGEKWSHPNIHACETINWSGIDITRKRGGEVQCMKQLLRDEKV